ncbi:MAG TPA: hypothetical protein VJL88_13015 [Nitrospira sp.]|nr:hypothetical protein [Nitrospira sp.]
MLIELALSDIVELESATLLSVLDELPLVVGLDTAAPPVDDELSLEDSILLSVAQPPIMSPKNMIHSAFLSMAIPPQ